jgi:phosphohistidine phosphatase
MLSGQTEELLTMQVLLIRHAIAAPLGKPAKREEDRPLTELGRRRFEAVAQALRAIAPKPSALLTSPLLRARQTAAIAAKVWGDLEPATVPALVDGDWEAICRVLDEYGKADTVALVGHEPWISRAAARLLDASTADAFAFRKGGVAFIEIDNPRAGHGRLLWFIPPKVFRRL